MSFEDYVAWFDKISGNDVKGICQEACIHTVMENRYIVLAKGYKNNIMKVKMELELYK